MTNWQQRLAASLFQKSRDMTPPWGPIVRFLRFPVAIARDWLAGEINVRAMSLAYTTLLSLVPLLVFSFLILKSIGAHGDLHYLLDEFFRPLGSADQQLTDKVLQFVNNMRGDVLGTIGLASLLYTVVTTIQKVEASFNFVWQIERPRGIARRIAEYLAVMIFGPMLLAAVVGILASAEQSPVAHWLHAVRPLAWFIALLGRSVPYAIVTVVFTVMYVFVPNTHVEFRAAVVGGIAAGIAWALVGKIFTAVITYSSQLMVVYTGFAVVLSTLIWIYLSWLILLFGAQLAFYVQRPEHLRRGHAAAVLTGGTRERAALSVMYLIARDHGRERERWTGERLADELDVPASVLRPVLDGLEQAGLIVVADSRQIEAAREPAEVGVAAVVDAVRGVDPE